MRIYHIILCTFVSMSFQCLYIFYNVLIHNFNLYANPLLQNLLYWNFSLFNVLTLLRFNLIKIITFLSFLYINHILVLICLLFNQKIILQRFPSLSSSKPITQYVSFYDSFSLRFWIFLYYHPLYTTHSHMTLWISNSRIFLQTTSNHKNIINVVFSHHCYQNKEVYLLSINQFSIRKLSIKTFIRFFL